MIAHASPCCQVAVVMVAHVRRCGHQVGRVVLAGPQGRSIETIDEILQGDPPLALWMALKADRLASAPPRSLGDLAALLAEHGLSWLQWDAEPADVELDAAIKEDIAARVAVAVVASKVAAELASVHGDGASQQARLLALLQDPGQWLAALKRTGAGQSEFPPPKWLSPPRFDPAVIEAVERAVRSIGTPPVSSGILVMLPTKPAVSSSHLRLGLEAASRWAATHQAAGWLKALMARLARLSILGAIVRRGGRGQKNRGDGQVCRQRGPRAQQSPGRHCRTGTTSFARRSRPERRRDLALMNAQAMRVHEMIADLRFFASPPELERQIARFNRPGRQRDRRIAALGRPAGNDRGLRRRDRARSGSRPIPCS